MLLRSGAHIIGENHHNILHIMSFASEDWIPVMKEIPGFQELVRMRDDNGRLPQHFASSKKMYDFLATSAGFKEDRPLDGPGELGDIESVRQVLLHPKRDELIMVHPGDGLSRWCYTPRLEWVGGVMTSHHDIRLSLAPDGNEFVMLSKTLWGAELRRFDDLKVSRRLEGDGSWYFLNGNWAPGQEMLMMTTKYEDRSERGVTGVRLDSEQFSHFTMEELKIKSNEWDGNAISPEGKKWAFVIIRDDYYCLNVSLNVVPFPFREGERTRSCCFPVDVESIQEVLGIVFHPDSDRVFFYFNAENRSFEEDRLIACSVSENRILWDVTIQSGVDRFLIPSIRSSWLVVKEEEIVCATPEGKLLFLDVETGDLLREVPVDGKLLAIGLHPDGDKLRVATDRQMHLVEWNGE
ncbi:hypothetical protein [Staphylospora marina]|uniref:hypothetical protein n=1 Tax=Staphylospora marina TaxID=2490858 RepID=UPI000F5BA7C0|nr:hypothetical protein [Staphylospora marina]